MRLGLFVFVAAVACINALALWGPRVARLGDIVLQAAVGAGAMICAVIVARRETGTARLWRLLVVAGCLSALVGQVGWSLAGAGLNAPPVSVLAYFGPPVFGLAALIVLARAGRGPA